MTGHLECSFCRRSDAQVRKLVAGGGGGYICDECVAIAARIIAASDSPSGGRGAWERMRSLVRKLVGRAGVERRPSVRMAAA
jgi:ATP-dependent protease Clp ATPase subunit